jgi:hypothetical protein
MTDVARAQTNVSKPLPNELIHALGKKPGHLSLAAGLEKRARGSSLAAGSKYFHFPATHFLSKN